MTRKFLSLATATGILYVYLLSQLHSGDALFLVTSPDFAVNIALLALAVGAVGVSYKDKFKKWESYLAAAVLAGILLFIGSAGIIYTSLDNYFSGLLKPMDYFIIFELGVTYAIASLSYSHPPVKLKVPSYDYSIPGLRIRRQLSGLLTRTVIFPGRRTPGARAV